ncbi:MAG: hypothetical protein MJ252_09985 [archaeon]|nr:hypothetical protein [archaeon]
MNLLDQKIKEKFKLFSDIDKEVVNKDKTMQIDPYKKKTDPTNLHKINQKKMEERPGNQFDRIYSDFFVNNRFGHPSGSVVNKDSKSSGKNYAGGGDYGLNFGGYDDLNSNGNTKKKGFYKNKSAKNIGTDKNLKRNSKKYGSEYYSTNFKSKNRSSGNSPSLTKSANNPPLPNNSGERLYNYGFYIQNKIEMKRQEEDQKMRKAMTPQINSKSKRMLSKNTPDRPNYKSLNSPGKKTESKNKLNNSNNQFVYHPKLNSRSLKIANKLEPSSVRLLKKKKKYNQNDSYNFINNSNYNFNSPYYNNRSSSKSSKRNLSTGNKGVELYEKGIELNKRKRKLLEDYKQKEDDEYKKKYSFKPTINKSSNILLNNQKVIEKNKKKADDEIYRKQKAWKKKLDYSNKRRKEKLDGILNKECTFNPDISHLEIKNDDAFILKNLAQMNDYVNKRREILKRQKEEQEYRNKRLWQIDQTKNFKMKTTVPREFYFESDTRLKGNKAKKVYIAPNTNLNSNINIRPNFNYGEPYIAQSPEINNQYVPDNYGNNLDYAYNNENFDNIMNDLKYKVNNMNV